MQSRCITRIRSTLLVASSVLALASARAGQSITEIIDSSGAGVGDPLRGAFDVAVDGSGNVFVAGFYYDPFSLCCPAVTSRVFKIAAGGLVTVIMDNFTYCEGPASVAVDGSGNVYVAGIFSNNVVKITPGGLITQIIGFSGDGSGNDLVFPADVAADGSGNVYVAGEATDNVFKISPAGVITEIIDSAGDGTGNSLDAPDGVAVDGSGNVYVTGGRSNNAFKITLAGVITEIIDSTGDGLGNPLGSPSQHSVAVDGSGSIYVTGLTSDNAFKITSAGVITEIIDSTGDGLGSPLDAPTGVAVDGFGNVYVTGWDSDNAFKITPAGVITEIIDSTGDGLGNPLDAPQGVAVDGSGHVYVTGYWSKNAFKICRPLGSSETARFGVPPNPGTLVPGAGGPPVIGTTWMPTVTGVPSVLDVVFADPQGSMINVPMAFGTVLCNTPPSSYFFFGGPGTPVSVPIPDDCALIGRAVCAQGAGISFGPLSLSMTNALDLVLGTY